MLITKDTKIIYRNELGAEVELSPFSPFFLEHFDEDLKNNIVTNKNSSSHGETYISSSLDCRYIEMSGIIENNSVVEQLVKKLQNVMNPTLEGTLLYTNKNIAREILCRLDNIPSISMQNGVMRFDVNVTCPDPLWQEKEKVEYIALLTPQLVFPVVIPINKGLVFGHKKSILETEVINVGDIRSGFRILFKARNGTLINPKIFNAITRNFIKINYAMEKGDVIEITNYPELKKITINGIVNGFKYLDMDSTFFELEVGKNLIGYAADENTINLDVVVYYVPRFLGV